jgi:hypothetical protein
VSEYLPVDERDPVLLFAYGLVALSTFVSSYSQHRNTIEFKTSDGGEYRITIEAKN